MGRPSPARGAAGLRLARAWMARSVAPLSSHSPDFDSPKLNVINEFFPTGISLCFPYLFSQPGFLWSFQWGMRLSLLALILLMFLFDVVG
jgi:hypothetical protein